MLQQETFILGISFLTGTASGKVVHLVGEDFLYFSFCTEQGSFPNWVSFWDIFSTCPYRKWFTVSWQSEKILNWTFCCGLTSQDQYILQSVLAIFLCFFSSGLKMRAESPPTQFVVDSGCCFLPQKIKVCVSFYLLGF